MRRAQKNVLDGERRRWVEGCVERGEEHGCHASSEDGLRDDQLKLRKLELLLWWRLKAVHGSVKLRRQSATSKRTARTDAIMSLETCQKTSDQLTIPKMLLK